jgi:arylsulfatase A-like enzyme
VKTAPASRTGACVAVALGWAAHDLVFYLVRGEPWLAVQLLPATLAALALAALGGFLWERRPRLAGLLLLALLAAAVLPRLVPLGLEAERRWLPRCAFAIGLLAFVVVRSGWRSPLSLGAFLGAGGALLVAAYRMGGVSLASWGLAGVALLAVLAGGVRRPALRRALGAVAFLGGAVLLVLATARGVRLRRPDLAPPAVQAAAQRPNLLLIVLDTVRADRLAPYGHRRVTTPALDAFAREHAVRHTSARSTSSWTLPSHASLLTGLHPDEHGATRPRAEHDAATVTLQAWPAQKLRADVPTLATRLRDAGFRTAALLANYTFLRHEYGLDRGFERYDDRRSTYVPEHVALAQTLGGARRVGRLPYRAGHVITDLAIDFLEEERSGPFFLLLNYMDAHAPYLPRAPHDTVFEPAPGEEPKALAYDRELRSLDAELGRLLAHLEDQDLLSRTVVIVTSDHGEAFGEHGTRLHGWDLHEETVRVPLYVKPVGLGHGGVSEEPIAGTEVMGLALELLGLASEQPTAGAPGMIGQLYLTEYLRDVWRGRGAERDLHQIAWLEDGLKLLVGRDGGVVAYDLATDPGETAPLELDEERAAAARARAAAWWAAHPPLRAEVPEIAPDDAARLQDLGYGGG